MIKFENVSVTYPGGVEALKDLDLEINQGDFIIIVGLSGAGKSHYLEQLIILLNLQMGLSTWKVKMLQMQRKEIWRIFVHKLV